MIDVYKCWKPIALLAYIWKQFNLCEFKYTYIHLCPDLRPELVLLLTVYSCLLCMGGCECVCVRGGAGGSYLYLEQHWGF